MTDLALLNGLVACSERTETLLREIERTKVRDFLAGQAASIERSLRSIKKKLTRNVSILRSGPTSSLPELAYLLDVLYQRVQGLSDMWIQIKNPSAEVEAADAITRLLVRETVPAPHTIHGRLVTSVHQMGGFLLTYLKTPEDRACPVLLNCSYLHRHDLLAQALLTHEIGHGLYEGMESTVDQAVNGAVEIVVKEIRTQAFGRTKEAGRALLASADAMINLWGEWRDEVAADVSAAFIAGPAYAVAFLREFAQDCLDEVRAEHPPRRIRWGAITRTLADSGFEDVLPELFAPMSDPDYSSGLLDAAEYEYLIRPAIADACTVASAESLERMGCRRFDSDAWQQALKAPHDKMSFLDVLAQAASRHMAGNLTQEWSSRAFELLRTKARPM